MIFPKLYTTKLEDNLGIDNLPKVTEGKVCLIGAPESISILESRTEFGTSLSEVIDRYPTTKMYAQDSEGNVISREEILNKFRVQYPDYPDKARNGKLVKSVNYED